MKEREFELGIFAKYLIRYFLVLFAFLLLVYPLYDMVYDVVKKNTIESEAKVIQENIRILDRKIEKMQTIANILSRDKYFVELSNIKGEPSNAQYYTISKAQSILKDLRAQYDIDTQIYVLFKNNKIFISNTMVSQDYSEIFNNYLFYSDLTGEDIINKVMYSDNTSSFLPAQELTYMDGNVYNGFTYIINSGASGASYKSSFGVVCTFDVHDILEFTNLADKKGLERKDGFLQITDRDGNILLNYNYTGEAVDMEVGSKDVKIDGEDYSLIKVKTNYGNLNVVRGIKSTVFDQQVGSILKMIKIYILLAILISIALSFMMTYKRFVAVRDIIRVVKPNDNKSIAGSEYKYIKNVITDAINKNEAYENSITLMKKSICRSMIENLLFCGIYSAKEKNELTRYLGYDIDYFCVVDVVADGVEKEFEDDAMHESVIVSESLKHNLITKYDDVILTNHGLENILLVLVPKSEKPGNGVLYSEIKSFYQEIYNELNYPIKIGISNIGHDASNVRFCYLQAKQAVRQFSYNDEIPVKKVEIEDSYDRNLEAFNLEHQLYELITAGDEAGIKVLFERIDRHISKISFLSEQDIMQMFFDVRNPILNAKKVIIKNNEEFNIPGYDVNISVNILMKQLEDIALELCKKSIKKEKDTKSELQEAVFNYIESEYHNPNLSAMIIAEKFFVAEKYIYNFIKEKTGMSLGKYIERIRHEKAKELLLTTNKSASEISQMVGFNSINTFYKSFSRVYGMPPIAWRENNKK